MKFVVYGTRIGGVKRKKNISIERVEKMVILKLNDKMNLKLVEEFSNNEVFNFQVINF